MLSFRFTIKRFNLRKLLPRQQNTGYKTSAESRCIFMLYIIPPPVYHSKAHEHALLVLLAITGAGIARLVERPTENPASTYMGSSPQCGMAFFSQSQLPVQTLVSMQLPVCSDMHWNICAPNKTLAAIPMFGYMKMLHTQIGMGSTALMAPVPYPGMVTQTSCMGQSTKNI